MGTVDVISGKEVSLQFSLGPQRPSLLMRLYRNTHAYTLSNRFSEQCIADKEEKEASTVNACFSVLLLSLIRQECEQGDNTQLETVEGERKNHRKIDGSELGNSEFTSRERPVHRAVTMTVL